MVLKERLIEQRQSLCLSKKEVAEKLNLEQSTYGKYELGHRQPSLEILVRIALLFNVSANYLLGLTDSPTQLDEATPPKDLLVFEISKLSQDNKKKAESYIKFLNTEEA
jgi:transcriptional regulator with XRE-family HTH domain